MNPATRFSIVPVVLAGTAGAQPEQAEFILPTSRDGLSDGNVWPILQSRDGTLWVGTGTGLTAMGPRTHSFTSIDFETTLPADSLWLVAALDVHRTTDGTIWVATRHGPNAFPESDDGAFRQHRHDPDVPAYIHSRGIAVITDDGEGRIWLGGLPDGPHPVEK